MKTLFTYVFLFAIMCQFAMAQNYGVLLVEDFETGALPAGWSRVQATGSDGWTFGVTSYMTGSWDVPASLDASQFAISNDDDCNCDMSNDQLNSPVLNLTSFDSVYFLFDRFYTAEWGSAAYFTISYDAGVTWLYLAMTEDPSWIEDGVVLPTTITVSGTDYTFNDQMMFGFLHDDGTAWADGFAIDNVVVAGFNNPCDDIVTIPSCSAPQTLTLGGAGVLDFFFTGPCGFNVGGQEQLYSFTPSVSGVHTLDITAATGNSWLDYMFKPASLGCDSLGWTCLIDADTLGSYPMNLTAGTEYLILVDNEFIDTETQTFSIQCPCSYTSQGNTAESEACGADVNGGCLNIPGPSTYESIACGGSVSGTLWADAGIRDLDWFELVVTENTNIDVAFSGGMPLVVAVAASCASIGTPLATEITDVCGSGSLTYAATPGTYVMAIYPLAFDQYPCGSGSNNYDMTVTYCEVVTGIDASDKIAANVYPNPSNGLFTVSIDGAEGKGQLLITDMAGRMVYSEAILLSNNFKKNLSIDLSSGSYILNVMTESSNLIQKIQVK